MRADRPLWIVIAALGIAVLALAMRHEQDTIAGIHPGSIAALITGAVLVVMMFGAVYALFYKRIGELLRAAVFWCAVAGLLFAGYSFRVQLQGIGEQALAELVPGIAMIAQASSGRSVEIVRAREADFTIRAEVNGARVAMLVDTGASSVVLSAEAAKAETERKEADRAAAAKAEADRVAATKAAAEKAEADRVATIKQRMQKNLNDGKAAEGELSANQLQKDDLIVVDGDIRGVARRDGPHTHLYWLNGELNLERVELSPLGDNRYKVNEPLRADVVLRARRVQKDANK